MLNGFSSRRTVQTLVGAFAFKSLASSITIYSITKGTAVELAPASSILILDYGVIFATLIVNIIWAGAVVSSFWIIQKMIIDRKIQQRTRRLAVLFVTGIAAFDGLWDLAVLLSFNQIYIISIGLLFASIISLYVLKFYGGFQLNSWAMKRRRVLSVQRGQNNLRYLSAQITGLGYFIRTRISHNVN
jgi:hypothetical protein